MQAIPDLPLSLRFRTIIRGAQVPKDDASVVLNAAYKAAADAGLHLAALKLCCKLSRQDLSKTMAFLEAFDEYRADFGLDDQESLPFPEEEQHLAERNGEEPDIAGAMLDAIEADGGEDKGKPISALHLVPKARGRRASRSEVSPAA